MGELKSPSSRWRPVVTGGSHRELAARAQHHHHCDAATCCCSRVQAKVRRNGRGGWTNEEVRFANLPPQFANPARQLSPGDAPASGLPFRPCRPFLRLQDDLLRHLVAENGAKNWKALGERAPRGGVCRWCHRQLSPAAASRRAGGFSGCTRASPRPPDATASTPHKPLYDPCTLILAASVPPTPPDLPSCPPPPRSRALCRPHRRAVPAPLAEGAQPRGAQRALDRRGGQSHHAVSAHRRCGGGTPPARPPATFPPAPRARRVHPRGSARPQWPW